MRWTCRLLRHLDPDLGALYESVNGPVKLVLRNLYGLGPSGKGFVTQFINWLRMNSWVVVEEEPGIL